MKADGAGGRNRHLDASQRAMVAGKIANLPEGRPDKNSVNLRSFRSTSVQIAKVGKFADPPTKRNCGCRRLVVKGSKITPSDILPNINMGRMGRVGRHFGYNGYTRAHDAHRRAYSVDADFAAQCAPCRPILPIGNPHWQMRRFR